MKPSSLVLLLALYSCASHEPRSGGSDRKKVTELRDLDSILDRAEDKASPEGKEILTTSRSLIAKKKVVVGSCWDYINMVFNHADYPESRRRFVLKNKKRGPYADAKQIQPGDWLYYINHSYSGVDHSGVFVEWLDEDRRSAVIMSYVGGRNRAPASYRVYDLSNVYHIIRPVK